MNTTLVVLAHPDRRSFNGAWAKATGKASAALGHTVLWSDLTAMEFDPVEAARHYRRSLSDGVFDPLKEQEKAAETGRIPKDVAGEIDKLRRADRVVFHFPLWWFGPPAILKGWFDRVFAHGATHSVEERFDTGRFLGRKALFCVTTGSNEAESAFNGKEGDVQMLLWPAAYALRYLGFTVLVPEIVHGVHGYHKGARAERLRDHLTSVLKAQPDVMAAFDRRPALHFNSDAEFDAQGRLKPQSPSHSLFIRHTP
ncbi:MAG: NAD(P)H-dependent oxidoreductase [Rhodobacter sp.]|nr:NAD(P)H-dependent oxidoreductase [Rhodobacter sp.]